MASPLPHGSVSDPTTTTSPLASASHCAVGPAAEGGEGAWPSDPSPPPSPPPPSSPPAPRAGDDAAAAAAAAASRGRRRRRRSASASRGSRWPVADPTRRDPRRAELFRRLEELADSDEESPLKQQTPPPEVKEILTPIEIVNKYRRMLKSSPANPVLNPNEKSASSTPSKNSQRLLLDIDGGRCNHDGHPSESTSHEMVLYQKDEIDRRQDGPGAHNLFPGPSNPSKGGLTFQVFVVQCWNCTKLRITPTKEKYEEIRERIVNEPFVCEQACEWKPDVTCDDPTDISYDDIWAFDKHGIPQTPPGWERLTKIRTEGTTRFADVYYISPNGHKLRSGVQVEKYLLENPVYAEQGVDISQFSFAIPAPPQHEYIIKYRPRSTQCKVEHPLQPEALPLAWAAPPTHEDFVSNMLVPYDEDPPAPVLLLGVPPKKKRRVAQSKGM